MLKEFFVITLEQIRSYATALPEVEEGTHFRMPAFKVAGKGFVGLERRHTYLTAAVDQAVAQAAVAADPDAYEEMWRGGETFVGPRVDLAKVSAEHVYELIEQAWLNRAPKRLAATYGKGSDARFR